MKHWSDEGVEKHKPCGGAVKWLRTQPSIETAWETCERGDWMLWILGRIAGDPDSGSRKKLVLTACKCARLWLKYVKGGETRPLAAIETAERWAQNEKGVTLQMVRDAADAAYAAYAAYAAADAAYAAYAAYAAADAADVAYAAADAAYAAYAADAAYAAAYAADAADAAYAAAYAAYAADAADAAYAAADAAYAAYAADAAYATVYAADAAAKTNTLKRCADIVREFYPDMPKGGG